MASQGDTMSGYMHQSDQGSNSERSTDSPLPGSEDDSPGPAAPHDPEWGEERFRVDRKKLETMLQAAAEGKGKSGEDFFQKIMEETNTQIAWPSKLKIGAKSKKDPHIKVSGKKENVKEAKERIMSVLDTKSNRVTLKMDVSHTEHSHVIGKGGNNIKKVMEETGCHIHFPDSNRNNQAEKSNQSSRTGKLSIGKPKITGSSERLLSDSEMSPADGPVTDKKAPGSERAAERAAQQNSERVRLNSQSSFTNMQAYDYEQKKLLATKAMLKKPVVTEVRTPTNTWSGLGFSKSMPAETIKELRRANHVSYKPTMSTTYEAPSMSLSRSNSREQLGGGSDSDNWRERNGIDSSHDYSSSIGSPKRKQNKSAEHYLSSSNYMDCISSLTGSNGCNLNSSFKGSDLPELFSKLGLGKYTDIFQQQEIDLQTFLTLTDQDLKELGITTFGARRKMLLAISELNKNRRKLFEPTNIRSSFLEGGASGRLPRQYHTEIASVSGRW
uniref:SAM domain-containing protein n=1 Tax=Pyxicephalus adspersus TaxID=30357 RepID=A0AAV2ZJ29_PYXAD|nr:TPA: hypothetical protein GDO54_004434 [Pyxicephalus adspersus]